MRCSLDATVIPAVGGMTITALERGELRDSEVTTRSLASPHHTAIWIES